MENILEGIMSNEEFQDLMKASELGKDYSYNKNGLDIKLTNSKDGFEARLSYKHPTQSEVDAFTEYCDSLDDELFVGICESIGKEGLQRMQDCLESENPESVRSAVQFFKSHAKTYINTKIAELQVQLKNI